MKKMAVILAAATILFGSLATSIAANAFVSYSQRCYFTYYTGCPYYGFIYDYSQSLQESVTPGMISYDTYLSFTAQTPVAMTTHVAYIYNSSLGRYTEAMAFLEQNL